MEPEISNHDVLIWAKVNSNAQSQEIYILRIDFSYKKNSLQGKAK